MTHQYILVASSTKLEERNISSVEVIRERLKKGYWPLQERTKHRERFRPGDKVVFYAASENKHFIGSAIVASDNKMMGYRERERLECDFDQLLAAPYAIWLSNPLYFTTPVPVKDVLEHLSIVKNLEHWWVYFQGGALRISEVDFRNIVERGQGKESG